MWIGNYLFNKLLSNACHPDGCWRVEIKLGLVDRNMLESFSVHFLVTGLAGFKPEVSRKGFL